MIPILVITSDKYLKALQPFSFLFNKYWSADQHVEVIGFKKPDFDMPDNFSFYSMGNMAHYPITKWSNAILDYLALHQEIRHFILMLEDYWVTRCVDTEAVKMLYDYCVQFNNVLKMDLCADRLYAEGMIDYNVCGRLDLVKSSYASQYHMSLMAGIWNRELFMRFVIPNEDPWQVELEGTTRVAKEQDNVLVLGTRQWPVRHILAHRGGRPDELLLNGISSSDVYLMREAGILP